jgi:hypothetical protein
LNALVSLSLQGGINKDDTTYSKVGRWTDSQWVRFFEKSIEKIGGFEKLIEDAVLGVARSQLPWVDNNQNRRDAIGTHRRLYYYYAGQFTNITPIRATSTINTDPFVTTASSAIVEVTDTAHGAAAGDIVSFSGATAVGGITINGEYTITTLVDANTYTITHTSAASSSATGGGASVVAAYEISAGLEDSILAFGYGVGGYGVGTYGSIRTTSITLAARTWSLGVRGDSLYACPRGGSIYKWSPGDTRATLLTNAPTQNVGIFVEEGGIIVAFGAGGQKSNVQWCDQDLDTLWTPAIDNTAGDKLLAQTGELLAGATTEDQVSILWTELRAVRMQRITDDFVFAFRSFPENTGIIGPNAGASLQSRFFWMGQDDFLMSDGAQVVPIPNSEDIRRYVFGDINVTQGAKCFAGINAQFSEVWFFYCSASSDEVNRYVSVNIKDFSWFNGNIDSFPRTSWADKGIYEAPFAFDPDGYMYQHETGKDADGAAIDAYVKTAPFADPSGRTIEVLSVIPDIKNQVGDVTVAIMVREDPQDSETTDDTVTLTTTSEAEEPRAAGRLVAFRIRSNAVGGDFRMGKPEFQAILTGARGRR